MQAIRVHTFSAAWGLPTASPFGLKLVKWLDLAGVPYELAHSDNPAKGPKGKAPWAEVGGEIIADSEIIIARLAAASGFDVDAALSEAEKAVAHAVRRMFEEHFHQVVEWELILHPASTEAIKGFIRNVVPDALMPIALPVYRHRMRRQLHERGLARHASDIIAEKGRYDIDCFETLLGDKPFLFGDAPSMADLAAFGQLALTVRWPMNTPVASYARSRPQIVRFVERTLDAGAWGRQACP